MGSPTQDAGRLRRRIGRPGLALVLMAICAPAIGGGRAEGMLLDDFSRDDGFSTLGTAWRFFTDGVMGGVSSGEARPENVDGRRCLRLRGSVSLENNGGFIQVALPLGELDAGDYSGVRLTVRGNGQRYYVHLRTADTRLPWQYYFADFPVSPTWESVELPFAAFEPAALSAPLNTRRLRRIALVAARRAFEADICVAELSLFR